MLSKRQKYDYHDVDRYELKLIRAGHAVWALYKRDRATLGGSHVQTLATLAACEDIWEAKRKYRLELKAKRAASFAKWRASEGR